MSNKAVLVLLISLAVIAMMSGCVPDIKLPSISIPIPSITAPGTSTPNVTKTSSSPAETTVTNFPFIKYGEGKAFLKQPLFFSSWCQDWSFYGRIPKLNSGWDAALREDAAGKKWFTEYLNQFLKRGQHYLGAGLTPMHEPGEDYSPKPNLACIDIDGKPITVTKPGMGTYLQGQYWMNLLNPGWQDILITRTKAMIDMGVEGVVIDESTFNQQIIFKRGGTFDEYSMTGFRNYLKGKYTASELKSKFDINAIDSFNFKDYIIAKNLKDTWNASELPPIPITYEFGLFQLTESGKFWRRMAAETKDYARQKYGREFFFSFSAAPEFATHFMPTDYIDYLTGEHFYFHGSFEVPKSAVVIKMSEGLAPRMAILVEVCHDLGTLPQNTTDMFKYIFADIYSADGYMMIDGNAFKTMLGWDYMDNKKVNYNVDEAAKYVAFAHAHPEFYGLNESAKVGVLHSIASRRHYMNPYVEEGSFNETSIKGLVDMLLNMNVPFKTIVSGDGELITETLTAADMSGLDVVVLPRVTMVSNEEVNALLDYVKNGGSVIQIDLFGTHDKNGKAVNRLELETLQEPGEHNIGKGKWFTITDDIGYQYAYNENQKRLYLPTERAKTDAPFTTFREALLHYYKLEIETDAPITLNIRRYVDNGRVFLHMANYDYNQVKDKLTPAGQFTVTITLPEGIIPKTALLHDFEQAKTTEIKFTVADGKATFTIPSVYAYAVVELK
jgi:hypothetical protein